MKFLLILSAITLATAARLDHLLARSSDAVVINAVPTSTPNYGRHYASIVRLANDATDNGYRYSYEGSDGSRADQQGVVIPGATEDTGSLQVQGSYSYVGTDGQTYSITYTADENGFRANGAHLPTPPPVPEAIARALTGQYSNNLRNSYQADPGYKY